MTRAPITVFADGVLAAGVFAAGVLALAMAAGTAQAQSLPYGDPGDSEAISGGGDDAPTVTGEGARGGSSRRGASDRGHNLG
ncbi:MAG: hypothetical protein K2X68_14440, partial [Novosphingobium sp.]|nr:hypothetical protein [Novosphingobium sp.]